MPNRVVHSINNDAGNHCVDIFVREDGTYGFEEFRRDHEDQRGWFSLQLYSGLRFATVEEAAVKAKASLAWMPDGAAPLE